MHAEKIIPASLEVLSSHLTSVALAGLTARGSLWSTYFGVGKNHCFIQILGEPPQEEKAVL